MRAAACGNFACYFRDPRATNHPSESGERLIYSMVLAPIERPSSVIPGVRSAG